jgi:hypothetical protein
MHEGADYEIYMVADASGGTSVDAHKYAMDRMVQAGVVPVTWQQVLLEWQRDWARKETYDAVTWLVKEHSGAYGMGIDYAVTMVHDGEERVTHGKRIGPNPAKWPAEPRQIAQALRGHRSRAPLSNWRARRWSPTYRRSCMIFMCRRPGRGHCAVAPRRIEVRDQLLRRSP